MANWFTKRFGTFTTAQARTLPLVQAGLSVLLSSPTGTGKTLAAFLSVFDDLARAERAAQSGAKKPDKSVNPLGPGIHALYVSPLRALAYDLAKNLNNPLHEMGFEFVRVALRTGDTSQKDRAAQKRKPPHILATTPESLALLLSQAGWREALSRVRYLIVDELHAFCESKRGTHLMLSAERLERMTTLPLIRIGLSATIAPLEEVGRYLTGPERSCEIVEVPAERASHIEVFSPLRKNPYPAAGYTATRLVAELAEVVTTNRTTLFFTNTRSGAESIGLQLKGKLPQLAEQIEVHHASLDRDVRLTVEDRLKNGELRAVVCSTSLELGIDIGSIDQVVMISAPKGVARALQRLGRSGHSLNEVSRGLLAATNINDLVECAVTARQMDERLLEPVRLSGIATDVLAQHLVGMAIEGAMTADEAFDLCRRSYPFRDLNRGDFDRVVRYLQGGGESLEEQYTPIFGKLQIKDRKLVVPAPRVARDYYQNVGTIAAEPMVTVKLGRRRLGEVEESFIKRLNKGDVFVLNGQTVKLLETRLLTATVTPARGQMVTVPRWNANKMPLATGLANEVAQLRGTLAGMLGAGADGEAEAVDYLIEEYSLTNGNAEAVVKQFATQARVSVIPTAGELLVEVFPEPPRVHVFFHSLIGRSANDALSRIIAWRVQERKGGNAMVTIDDYGMLLTLRDFQAMELEEWRELFGPKNAEADLACALRDSELVKWQFRGVAQTGLMVPRNLAGKERKHRAMQWSAEVLFEVLLKHEPEHVLLREAYREATHRFLDLPGAITFLKRASHLPWRMVPVKRVSPFAFGIFVSKIKEAMMLEDQETAIDRLYHEMYQELEEARVGAGVESGLEGVSA